MRRFPFPLVAALAVSLAASLAGCRRPPPSIQGAQGNIALARLDGVPVKLADYGRKVTVIALWNNACAPCLKELPHLDELAKSYAGDPDVAILAVNVTDELPAARETVAKLGLKLPVLSDAKGELTHLLSPNVLAIPLLAVIDASFAIHTETGFPEDGATTFVPNKRALIESARRGAMPPDGPPAAGGPAGSGSGFPAVRPAGSITPAQFQAVKSQMRASFKEQYHLSDEDADRMVASSEAQLQSDGGVPKVMVPSGSASR